MCPSDPLDDLKRDRERANSASLARERRDRLNAEHRMKTALRDVHKYSKGLPTIRIGDLCIHKLGEAMVLIESEGRRVDDITQEEIQRSLGYLCLQYSHALDPGFRGERPAKGKHEPHGFGDTPLAPMSADDDDL